ncbi:MAG TPA: DUF4157 domain-containing protein [Synechococcales cyanobacterium M55_K2018_004]|nr:DUF4157 domain-containing protein [Synechococcales cyanobacterium M55_K2018_004]
MPRQRLGSLLKPAQHHAASSHTFMQRPAAHHLRQERLLPRQAASTSDEQPPQFDFSHIPVTRGDRPTLQPKLKIGSVGDKYEQEADRIAAKVVNHIHSPQFPQQHETIQRQEQDKDEELQMKPALQASSEGIAVSPELEAEIGRSRAGGLPLSQPIRQPMEQVLGVDLSRVRVHTDGRSEHLNRSINAYAFTSGQDIFFRQDTYQPNNRDGQQLIAHELTHVLQQSGSQSTLNHLGIHRANSNVLQGRFGFEIELQMLLTSERTVKVEGGGSRTAMTEPIYIRQPKVAEGNGFDVHADHRSGQDSKMQNRDDSLTEPELFYQNAPIVELVTHPMDEFSMTEDEVAEVMQRLVNFATTAKTNSDDFTRRIALKDLPGISQASTNLYIGSERKKMLAPLNGGIQMTQGIRLDRLSAFFQEYTHPTDSRVKPLNKKIRDSMIRAEAVATQIVSFLQEEYKDPKRKSDGTKRFFKNTFQAPQDLSQMDELKGLLFLMANYLIVGNQDTGGYGWAKNLVGAVFYKSKLSEVVNRLTGFNRTILQKRPQKVAQKLLELTGRDPSEPVLYLKKASSSSESGEKIVGTSQSSQDWIMTVLTGKDDSVFNELKNQYGSDIKPEKIGPDGDKQTAVIMENRKLQSLISDSTGTGIQGADGNTGSWVQLGRDVYNLLRRINT